MIYHAGLYVQNEVEAMKANPFNIVLDRDGLWALDFVNDADIDLASHVAAIARAFVTGAGGLALPIRSVE